MTTGGIVATVESVESGFVRATIFGQSGLKIWKGAIVKVLPRELKGGDKVRTIDGRIGRLASDPDGDELTIQSGDDGPAAIYHRSAVCKVIERASESGSASSSGSGSGSGSASGSREK